MAMGFPVVGARVGGIRYYLEHERTGLFTNVDDAEDLARQITRLFTDGALYEKLSRNGREGVQKTYTWEPIVTNGKNKISNSPSLASSGVGRGGQFPISKQVSSSSPRSSESGAGKFQIQSVSRKLPKGIRHLAYFWQVLKQGLHTDIIYAQDAVSAGFPAALAALLLRKPFFLKIVGDHAWEQGQQRFGVVDTLDEFLAKRYGARVGFL